MAVGRGQDVTKRRDPLYPFIGAVLAYWDAHHVQYLPGVSRAELRSFEESNDLRLPDDVRAFYLTTNGVRVPDTDGVDHKQYDFWPLRELKRVEDNRSKLYFADHMQCMWQFALELEGPERGTVYVVPGEFIKLAPSFGEFMELYVANDVSLYPISWDKKSR